MGWRGVLRSIAAEARRAERESRRRQREIEREYIAAQRAAARAEAATEKALELAQAQHQVALYANHIARLTSIHREASLPIDWRAIASEPEPCPVPVDRSSSARAQEMLAVYRPSFWERLWGLTRRRTTLESSLQQALASEAQQEGKSRQQWTESVTQWKERRRIAAAVLSGDAQAYQDVAKGSGCLEELIELSGSDSVQVQFVSPRRAMVLLRAEEVDVVPREEVTLTTRGKISTKRLPDSRRTEIYQDYVCGAALRAARELMAVLPLEGVLVHVGCSLLNSATGHFERTTILSVYCPRDRFTVTDFDRVDASDMVSSLRHEMAFRRGKGFSSVQTLSLETMA